MMPVARILIVDDHPLVREGMKLLLKACPGWQICGEADSQFTAMRLVAETSPHLVIVDLSLKDGDGFELVKQIAAIPDPPRILVCTMHDESLYALRTIRAGAQGFLNKIAASDQLVFAVQKILEGGLFVSDEMQQQIDSQFSNTSRPDAKASLGSMTDRELQIFQAIGQGLTVAEIAAKLFLSPKTVETHRDRMKHKLKLKSAAELLRYAVTWAAERK